MQDVVDIQVTPLSSACGAEIEGVDLTKPLSESTVEAIKDAWGKHLVLVFRGQTFLKMISFGSLPISATWAAARKRRKSCAVAPRESSRTTKRFSW